MAVIYLATGAAYRKCGNYTALLVLAAVVVIVVVANETIGESIKVCELVYKNIGQSTPGNKSTAFIVFCGAFSRLVY